MTNTATNTIAGGLFSAPPVSKAAFNGLDPALAIAVVERIRTMPSSRRLDRSHALSMFVMQYCTYHADEMDADTLLALTPADAMHSISPTAALPLLRMFLKHFRSEGGVAKGKGKEKDDRASASASQGVGRKRGALVSPDERKAKKAKKAKKSRTGGQDEQDQQDEQDERDAGSSLRERCVKTCGESFRDVFAVGAAVGAVPSLSAVPKDIPPEVAIDILEVALQTAHNSLDTTSAELATKSNLLTTKNIELATKNNLLTTKNIELATKNTELSTARNETASKTRELAAKTKELADLTAAPAGAICNTCR